MSRMGLTSLFVPAQLSARQVYPGLPLPDSFRFLGGAFASSSSGSALVASFVDSSPSAFLAGLPLR
jgi:hypothetical protein